MTVSDNPNQVIDSSEWPRFAEGTGESVVEVDHFVDLIDSRLLDLSRQTADKWAEADKKLVRETAEMSRRSAQVLLEDQHRDRIGGDLAEKLSSVTRPVMASGEVIAKHRRDALGSTMGTDLPRIREHVRELGSGSRDSAVKVLNDLGTPLWAMEMDSTHGYNYIDAARGLLGVFRGIVAEHGGLHVTKYLSGNLNNLASTYYQAVSRS